ncbi:MAG: YgiQ family radical SAM protein [Candidatus Marinimicrobia bacterium CG08_land_8_20_14_0_20_45_22]|nr:MAG: YgiQ family radical SAM protein [Candidatus Marinimicrobia bacterium CG08_land_8_20_14_0_20_45_22]
MFLPTTKDEMKRLGWDVCDVILITGDAYIDSPHIGVAVVGKVLLNAGYRVGIIAQPALNVPDDITRLGEPALFWGVSGGSIDSMIANYTASLKKRRSDDFTPGGINNRRPDRATIVYANLIRRHFKDTKSIVLGGIEASLRRVAHYDYWSDKIRKSILFDAKADVLVYGMGEKTTIKIAERLKNGADFRDVRGICYIAKECPPNALLLPSYEEVVGNKRRFIDMFQTFYQNSDPITAKTLCQPNDDRFLIQNPPQFYETQNELDKIFGLNFERAIHPFDEKNGKVKALDTIRFSIATHRGCYGECNFCAIAVHEGRTVRSRSANSILQEAKQLTELPDFKGYIVDVGGPTANMYGFECRKKLTQGCCPNRHCLYPEICPLLKINHSRQTELLKSLRALPKVKKVFVASGIRYDMVLADKKNGAAYLRELVNHHVSGQLKIAPEHTEDNVLALMGKPSRESLIEFKNLFDLFSKQAKKEQYLTYYLIAAHPGCTYENMVKLRNFTSKELKIHPEQVQIFIPVPSTWSGVMYYTEIDPFTNRKIFVEKNLPQKELQKRIIVEKTPFVQKKTRRSGWKTGAHVRTPKKR